jgi:hypothetical protein
MKRILSTLTGSVVVYLVALVLLAPLGTASASYRAHHASLCHYFNDTEGTGLYSGAYVQNTTGSAKGIYCPVVSDGYLNIDAVTTVTLDVTEGDAGSYTKVCRADYYGWATTCGTQYDWITGNGQAYPSVTTWNDPYAYGYLYNWVTNNSKIYGYSLWE